MRTKDGKAITANKASAKLFGYSSKEEFIEKFVAPKHYVNPGDRKAIIEKLMLKGSIPRIEMHSKKRDGTLIWSLASFKLDSQKKYIDCVSIDITGKKEAEEKAAKARIYLEKSLSSVPFGVCLINKHGIYEYVNLAYLKIIGYEEKDIIGKTIQEIVLKIASPKTAKILTERAMRRLETGEPIIESEVELLNKKGKTIPIVYTASGIKDDSGNVIGEIAFIMDVTEKIKSEKDLLESEKNLRMAQHLAKIGSWKWTVATNTVQWSEELCKINGHDPKLPVPSFAEMSSFYTPESWKRLNEVVMKVFNNGESYELDLDLIRVDGVIIKTIARGEVLYDANGKIEYLQGTVQDITERKDAEDELRINRDHYRNLFDNMLEGFAHCKMIYDTDGSPIDWVYLHVNNNFELLTGLKNITGKKVTKAIPGIKDSNPELFEIYNRVVLTGQPESFEDYIGPLSIWLHLSVFSPAKGEFVAVFQNITEKKNAEKEIENLSRFPSENPNPVIRVSNKYSVLYANQHGNKILRKLDYKKGGKIPKVLSDLMISTNKGIIPKVKTPEIKIGNSIYGLTLISLEEGSYINIYGKDITIQKNAETALKKKQERKEEIINIERTRIERNLHDSVSQMLFSTRLIAEVLPDLWKKDRKEALIQLERIGTLTKESHSEMRRLLLELKPGSFSEEDLGDLIRQLGQSAKLHLDIPIKINIEGKTKKLSSKVKEVFYRICQEAINNIIKHSGASKVDIALIYFPEKTYLKIEDNGQGFEKRKMPHKKLGLYIMNERAKSIDASLNIESGKDKGTKIIFISKS